MEGQSEYLNTLSFFFKRLTSRSFNDRHLEGDGDLSTQIAEVFSDIDLLEVKAVVAWRL